jgi:hypothetical protein
MGNRHNWESKSNIKEQLPTKNNELRKKIKMGMEKHRHPSMGTSIPCTMDVEVISCSSPQVNHMHPMEEILILTSSQYSINVPSTNSVLVEEEIKIL